MLMRMGMRDRRRSKLRRGMRGVAAYGNAVSAALHFQLSDAVFIYSADQFFNLFNVNIHLFALAVVTRSLQDGKTLIGGCQNLTAIVGHHDGIFNPNTAELFVIDARFDRDGHAHFQFRLILSPYSWKFVNLQT
jgi:hypothetical protein